MEKSTEKQAVCKTCSFKLYPRKRSRYWLGKHRDDATKEVLRQKCRGWLHSDDTRKQMSLNNARYWKGKRPEIAIQAAAKAKLGTTASLETRRKHRENNFKRIQNKFSGSVVFPSYNPTAYVIFDEINTALGWNGIHALNGGEVEVIGYFVDYYEPNLNIVIEYDEKHHGYPSIKKKDDVRENLIRSHLSCSFFRISESQHWQEVLHAGSLQD